MSRCRCAGTCSCTLAAGANISITGSGEISDPYVITAGAAASSPAGGDLTGNYPNPQIAPGAIVNADISPTANIAQSKILNLEDDLHYLLNPEDLIAGTGIDISSDVDGIVTIAATGGGGGGHVIADEGTALTARATLNFVGAGVTATDDAANNRTVVTISSGGTEVFTSTAAPSATGFPIVWADTDSVALVREAGEWSDYDVNVTGNALGFGDGTVTGRYAVVGDTVLYRVALTIGPNSTVERGRVLVSKPLRGRANDEEHAHVAFTSPSGDIAMGFGLGFERNIVVLAWPGADGIGRDLDTDVPFTWTQGCRIIVSGTYEAV